jgi:excisionase family DNA binding protein
MDVSRGYVAHLIEAGVLPAQRRGRIVRLPLAVVNQLAEPAGEGQDVATRLSVARLRRAARGDKPRG